MLLNIVIAAALMVATTAIHAGGMILALQAIHSQKEVFKEHLRLRHIYRVGGVVLIMCFVSLLEVLVWAVTYLAVKAIQGFERALYFSSVTFTTLGYGDLVLQERRRLLASFEAANGIIMFGWTTAIVVAAIQRVYSQGEKPETWSEEKR